MEFLRRKGRRRHVALIVAGPVVVGALFGVCAVATNVASIREVLAWVAVGALMGAAAVGLLIHRDRRRSKTRKWRSQIDELADMLQASEPDLSREECIAVAQEHMEQAPGGSLFWFGMVVGGFSVLCAVAMAIIRAVVLFRDLLR